KPISTQRVYDIVHKLFVKAGVIKRKRGQRYDVCVHSLRKFFRTQMAAAGIPPEYIEYMMGHTLSVYHDIQSKGVEFLREMYKRAGLRIRPTATITKDLIRRVLLEKLDELTDEDIRRIAGAMPHRTIIHGEEEDTTYVLALVDILKEALRRGLENGRES
ncbi:MAG: hypothetical protein DRN54_04315, partial [Thaumarchaeota archaeon]